MTRFFVRRVLLGAFVMFCVTVIVYLIFYVGPGPGYVARALAGREAPPQTVALIAHRLLLDRPWYAQYGHFLFQLLQGNLGYDYYHGQSVNSIIAQAFPVTLSLTVGAATIWVTIGVLSGVASAVRPRSLLDRGATFTALIFYSMPTFVLGLLMLELLYYQLTVHGLRWFPGSGYTPPTQSIFEWFRGLVLPWFTLALVSAAAYTRLTRASMLDVLGEDYIRTARAKGLSESRITFRHALRAALDARCHPVRDRRRRPARWRGDHRERVRPPRPWLYRGAGHHQPGPAGDHRGRDRGIGGRRGRQHPRRRRLRRPRPAYQAPLSSQQDELHHP